MVGGGGRMSTGTRKGICMPLFVALSTLLDYQQAPSSVAASVQPQPPPPTRPLALPAAMPGQASIQDLPPGLLELCWAPLGLCER